MRNHLLLWGALLALLLVGCDIGDDTVVFTVSGTVITSAGDIPTGLGVSLIDPHGFTGGGSFVQANGTFVITGVRPGTYTLVVRQTLNGIPVRTETGPIIVVDRNVVVPQIIVPVAQDLAPIGTPTNAALAVFVRDVNRQLAPAFVQIQGVGPTFGPDAPVLVRGIPEGVRNVTVTTGGQSFTQPNVRFINGVITVLNFRVGQAPGIATVTGIVVNSAGVPVAGAPVALVLGTQQIAETTTVSGGAFSFPNVLAGTYTVQVTQVTGGVPVRSISSVFTVGAVDVAVPLVTVPTAQNLSGIGVPVNSALIVFPRDVNNLPILATVQVEGVAGSFGPTTPVVVPNVPVGTRDVIITAGLQSALRQDILFTAGTVTAVNVFL